MNSPFNLSRKYNTIAAIIGGTLLGAIVISAFLIRPAWDKLKQLGQEVPVEQQKRDAAEGKLSGLEKAKTYLGDEKEQVDQVNIAVPIEPQVPQILLILEQLAKDNRVRLTTFTPQVASSTVAQSGQSPTAPAAAPAAGSGTTGAVSAGQSLEVTANFQGSYASLISFFYTLEKSLRLIDVKSITVSGAQNTDGTQAGGGTLTGAITFTAYYKNVDGGPQTGGTK